MWNKKSLLKTLVPMVSCIFILVPLGAQAMGAVQGWGKVNMQGAIIDTACAIAVESRDQTIDMDVVPLADIIRDGQGQVKSFAIELVNCTLERANSPGVNGKSADWKQFQVTFDGDAEGALFGVRGDASGVALQISDVSGNIATPGTPLPLENIIPGDMRLDSRLGRRQ